MARQRSIATLRPSQAPYRTWARTRAALVVSMLSVVAPMAQAQPTAAAAQPLVPDGAERFVLPPVTAPAPPRSGLPTGTQTITFRRIVIRGNRAIASRELEAIAAGDLGRSLTAADVEDLRQRLTRYYVDRGFINSGAVFQPEALSGDTLVVDIVEGRLHLMRVSGLERLRESYVTQRLALVPDAALNVDELRDRFALLLEDPLFAQLNARLRPGDRLGEATLEIDAVRARPYQLQLFANNHRPPSVGAYAVGVAGQLRNLTGLGDALDASVQRPERLAGRGRASVGWRVPVPHTSAEVFLQHEQGESSVIEAQLRPLDIRSELRSDELGARYVLTESLGRKLSIGLSRSIRRNATTLQGEPFSFTPDEPSGVTRVAAWRFWQEASFRSSAHVIALRSTLTASSTNLQDNPGGPPEGFPRQPHRYAYWQGQGHYAKELDKESATQLVVRFAGQATSRPLVALDRFTVGGAATVRGFRENTLVRDRGAVANLEVERPVVRDGTAGLRLVVVPFVDVGWARNVGGPGETLASAGLSTRLRWHGLSVDLAVARKLIRPGVAEPGDRTLQDRGVHLQVGFSVF